MPLLCLECDTRVMPSLTKPTFYCSGCDKELTRDETYKVSKRFFQVESKEERAEKLRIKRKKKKGIKMKQRRLLRQKRG